MKDHEGKKYCSGKKIDLIMYTVFARFSNPYDFNFYKLCFLIYIYNYLVNKRLGCVIGIFYLNAEFRVPNWD